MMPNLIQKKTHERIETESDIIRGFNLIFDVVDYQVIFLNSQQPHKK